MKINSLQSKIKLIFLILLLSITALFAAYNLINNHTNMPEMRKRYLGTYIFIDKYFNESNHKDDVSFKRFLKANNFRIITDLKLKEHVLDIGHRIIDKQGRHIEFEVVRGEKEHYMYIKKPQFELLLEDTRERIFPYYLLWWYALALLLLLLFYFWITNNLRPLKELHKDIRRIGEGDLSISLKRDGGDEIADVANEFDNTLRKIEALVNSRQLFLRTIMHELKTPISKGRILTEILEDPLTQEKYETIFERLELLIEEFSQIEKMLSSHYTLNINEYNMYDIVDQAVELLILDDDVIDECITIEVKEHCALHTDFNFLALAIKNLLDNALKYSSDYQIKIEIEAYSITVINTAKPLKDDIESLFEPFHTHTDTSKGGLGLGLYLVKSITEKLDLDFTYMYQEGKHFFTIVKVH